MSAGKKGKTHSTAIPSRSGKECKILSRVFCPSAVKQPLSSIIKYMIQLILSP